MAMTNELKFPYTTRFASSQGIMSKAWQEVFQFLKRLIDPLGFEKTFTLENNKVAITKINGLRFNSNYLVSFIDFVIVRQMESICYVEAGRYRVVRRLAPQSNFILQLQSTSGPEDAQVDLYIDDETGEVSYTSSNIPDVHVRFTISLRISYLSGGNLIE